MTSEPLASLSSIATTPSVLSTAVDGTYRPTVAIIGGVIGASTAALSFHPADIYNKFYVPENRLRHSVRSAVFVGGSAIRTLDRLELEIEFSFLGAPVHNAAIISVRGSSRASFKPVYGIAEISKDQPRQERARTRRRFSLRSVESIADFLPNIAAIFLAPTTICCFACWLTLSTCMGRDHESLE